MQVSFNDLIRNHEALSQEIEDAVTSTMRSGWYILGKEVSAFEEQFAAYNNRKHAIAVANGTDAIELALRAWGIGAGDEVITVAHTAMPTVTAIERAGANPVLVDILPDTYLIDINAVEKAITPRTKAMIPVHLYGHPVEMTKLQALTDKHNLLLLEDCAQAHGARFNDKLVGTFGQMASFSFYPTKNLGAYGDAGGIVTDDDELADHLRRIRNYGQSAKYQNIERGVNSRMDDIQATILRIKLQYLNKHNEKRRQVAQFYTENLEGVVTPIEQQNAHHVYHLYVIRHSERDALQNYLANKGVQTAIHYPIPIHRQVSHLDLGYVEGSLPHTERAASEILSLPLYVHLQQSEQEYIIEMVNQFCKGN